LGSRGHWLRAQSEVTAYRARTIARSLSVSSFCRRRHRRRRDGHGMLGLLALGVANLPIDSTITQCHDCRRREIVSAISKLIEELEASENSLADPRSVQATPELNFNAGLQKHTKHGPHARMPITSLIVDSVLVAPLFFFAWRTSHAPLTLPDLRDSGADSNFYATARFRLSFEMHVFVFAVLLCSAAMQLLLSKNLWWSMLVACCGAALYLRGLVHFVEPARAHRYGDWLCHLSSSELDSHAQRAARNWHAAPLCTRQQPREQPPVARSDPVRSLPPSEPVRVVRPRRQCSSSSSTPSTSPPRPTRALGWRTSLCSS
jgi:hypothetical protein